jgi:hypothetical protein
MIKNRKPSLLHKLKDKFNRKVAHNTAITNSNDAANKKHRRNHIDVVQK